MVTFHEDERLIAIRNRAGHDAFFVVVSILTVLMALGLIVDMSSFFFPPAILLLPAFTGALVFVIRLRQGGYYRSMREEVQHRPALHRRQRWALVANGVFFAVLTYLTDLFIIPDIMGGEPAAERNHWLDIGKAVFEGLFFAFIMWLLFFRKYRPKDTQEEQE